MAMKQSELDRPSSWKGHWVRLNKKTLPKQKNTRIPSKWSRQCLVKLPSNRFVDPGELTTVPILLSQTLQQAEHVDVELDRTDTFSSKIDNEKLDGRTISCLPRLSKVQHLLFGGSGSSASSSVATPKSSSHTTQWNPFGMKFLQTVINSRISQKIQTHQQILTKQDTFN